MTRWSDAPLDDLTAAVAGSDLWNAPGVPDHGLAPLRVRAASEWLTVRYPNLCQLNTAKKSGWTEVRLRDKRPAWKKEGLLA